MYRLVILDFDGVVLESIAVKTNAFRTLFSDEPDHIEEIVDFHVKNGGMSRFNKFRYIYKNILKRELDQTTFDRLSERFAGIVFDAVIRVAFVPGAEEFLSRWSTRLPLYIVSATPERELKEIVEARNLGKYFQEVFGAPRNKTDCICEILVGSGTSGSEALFVGDALNDLTAARDAGVRFAGRVKDGDPDVFRGAPGVDTVVADLSGLSHYLEGKT
ncbi:MAG TPA: HAD-IA family hydrolase [Methanoregula sp.]|nr:HAD-IA family hydrolase [Methanoregula sp.]